MNVNRTSAVVAVLAVLLVLSVGYIVFDKIEQQRLADLQEAFDIGFNQGASDAITAMFVQTNDCQPLPLMVGNATKEVVDVACLQPVPS